MATFLMLRTSTTQTRSQFGVREICRNASRAVELSQNHPYAYRITTYLTRKSLRGLYSQQYRYSFDRSFPYWERALLRLGASGPPRVHSAMTHTVLPPAASFDSTGTTSTNRLYKIASEGQDHKPGPLARFCAAALVVSGSIALVAALLLILPFPSGSDSFITYENRPDTWVFLLILSLAGSAFLIRVLIGLSHLRAFVGGGALTKSVFGLCAKPSVEQNANANVNDLLLYCHKRFNRESVVSARIHLTRPSLITPRIGHTIEPTEYSETSTFLRRIDQFRRSQAYDQVAVVHRFKKGHIPASFSIEVDEKEWTTLSARDSKAILIGVLHSMYAALTSTNRLDNVFQSIATGVICDEAVRGTAVASHPISGASLKNASGEVLTLKDYLDTLQAELVQEGAPRSAVDSLIYLLADLCQDHIIWCSLRVPALGDDSVPWNRIRYSYTAAPPRRRSEASERIRSILGMSPRKLRYALPYARETQSLHFDMPVLDGLYMYDIYLELIESSPLEWTEPRVMKRFTKLQRARPKRFDGDSRRRIIPQARKATRRYLRVSNVGHTNPRLGAVGVGGHRGHVYLRESERLYTTNSHEGRSRQLIPAVVFEMRERLPGLLLPCLFVSMYTAFVVWSVGVLHARVFASDAPLPAMWTTLIFGLPALISAWILTKFTASSMQRISIPVLFISVWTLCNALLTVAISVVAVGRSSHLQWDGHEIRLWPTSYSIHTELETTIGEFDVLWGLLTFSSSLNVVIVIAVLSGKYARYVYRRY